MPRSGLALPSGRGVACGPWGQRVLQACPTAPPPLLTAPTLQRQPTCLEGDRAQRCLCMLRQVHCVIQHSIMAQPRDILTNYFILLQPNTSLLSYFAVFNWPTGKHDAYRNISAAFYCPQLLLRADFFDKLQLIRASKSPHASAVPLWL